MSEIMETANPSGAVENTASIHERILAKLTPAEPEVKTETEVKTEDPEKEEVAQVSEVEAVQTDEKDDTTVEKPQVEDDAGSRFESVDDLASALDMSVEDFANAIKTKIKIDGQESEITLAELRAGYQKDADYRRKTAEVAEQRRTLEQYGEQSKAEIQNRLGQVNALVDNLQNQILGEFQTIDWNSLRANNPGEYAARLQEFQSRQLQLEQIKGTSQQEAQRLAQEQQEKQKGSYQAYVQQETEALMTAIPAWRDVEVAKAETSQLATFLKDRGFNESEIGNAADHRIIKLAYDLMKVDTVKQTAEVVKNKIKNLPKLVKPGAKQTNSTADREKDLKAKIKKGDSNAMHELLKLRLSR